MPDAYPYQQLYDRLRENGYHAEEDRTSHLAPYIDWLQQRLNYKTALDIGCSVGGSIPLLGSAGQSITGVEVSAIAVEEARSLGRNVVQASATSLPFPDNHFDLVVSADVFEHLHEDDAQAAADEAIRVAKSHIFMKIASREDITKKWKDLAGHPLHLTTRPIEWWMKYFEKAGKFIRRESEAFCLEVT